MVPRKHRVLETHKDCAFRRMFYFVLITSFVPFHHTSFPYLNTCTSRDTKSARKVSPMAVGMGIPQLNPKLLLRLFVLSPYGPYAEDAPSDLNTGETGLRTKTKMHRAYFGTTTLHKKHNGTLQLRLVKPARIILLIHRCV